MYNKTLNEYKIYQKFKNGKLSINMSIYTSSLYVEYVSLNLYDKEEIKRLINIFFEPHKIIEHYITENDILNNKF